MYYGCLLDALTPPVFEHPFASAVLALSRFPRESLNVILERASVDRMLPPSLAKQQLVDALLVIGQLVGLSPLLISLSYRAPHQWATSFVSSSDQ
jgi:hypothetical protein